MGENDSSDGIGPPPRCGRPHTDDTTANINKVKDLPLIFSRVSLDH